MTHKKFHTLFIKILLKRMVAFDKNEGHAPCCLKQGDGDCVGVVLRLDSQCGGTLGLQTKTTHREYMLARMQKKVL